MKYRVYENKKKVAERSKVRVCCHSFDRVAGLNPAGGREYLPLLSVVFCQVLPTLLCHWV